jgi:hypothetical protein
MSLALATLFALACGEGFGVAIEQPVPSLTVYDPAPVLDVSIGDTLEIAEPTVGGGVPPYEWTYHADAPYLHVVSTDPLRVYASDGGHPKIVATVHDAAGQKESTEIEVRLIPRARVEGRWHMAHTLGADTVQLWMDLMPGRPWCPDTYKGVCVNPNCATMNDGYPGYDPCPTRSFNIGGQVKWQVGERDGFWPDPFTWLPWPRTSYANATKVLLNIGVVGGIGLCDLGTYAEFRGSLNDDATELSGMLVYECDYIYPGIPSPGNPSGNVTFHLQADASR